MKEDQREIQLGLLILGHAAASGNVCMTCRYFGVGRASFYRWQSVYRLHGEEGLTSRRPSHEHEFSRRQANFRNGS